MQVEIIKGNDPTCEQFVGRMSSAKLCHLTAWSDAIGLAVGHRQYYLAARNGSQIHGVLPLTHVNSRLFGNRLISQAFSNYGGLLAELPEARDALFAYAVELATDLNCEFIEFRNVAPLPYELITNTEKICMHLSLPVDPDALWKSFKPKVRNQVRKAEKSEIIPENGHLELLDDFYRIYTIRMHQLGTPAYPRKWFYTLLKAFPNRTRIFVVRLGRLSVGVGFVVRFEGFVEIPWASTLVEYNNLCPNNLLYWSVMKHYCLAGGKWFDFGRCTIGAGTHRFKQQWGPKPVPLHYQYWVRPGHSLSKATPDNPKYQKKVQLWKKLPLWLTRLLGPRISRQLP